MIELPLIFLGGLLGSSHCVGMCGGFALSIGGRAAGLADNLRRQAAYTAGRVFTYAFLGAMAGYLGFRVAVESTLLVNVQALFSLAAGCLLVAVGLRSAGLLPRRGVAASAAGFCPARSLFASFLTAPGLVNALVAGVLTGFLPCGLVYAYLGLAVSSGSMLNGSAAMALFGLGTAPLMVLAGAGGGLLTLTARQRALRLAAWCVIVTGALTIGRGAMGLQDGNQNGPACPFCTSVGQPTPVTAPPEQTAVSVPR